MGIAARKGRKFDQPAWNEPQRTLENNPSAASKPVGVEVGMRLQKAGNGWDEVRV